jgi:hypothetical protein
MTRQICAVGRLLAVGGVQTNTETKANRAQHLDSDLIDSRQIMVSTDKSSAYALSVDG